ncbi:MAG: T9SS type A sorting domain-containing protein [Candidatus Eisenbacteria bacterium]|nr:T9SS type A sorting domain-containing protein [Candidatus Eisenbacteria bacterium]
MLKLLFGGLVILGVLQVPPIVPRQPADETVMLRTHDPSLTKKSALETYPPEARGYPSDLMRTKEFRQRFHVTKDKKSHGFDNPGEFFRLHQEIRTRSTEPAPSYPPNYRMIELEKARARAHKGTRLDWVDRGPANVSGRTRAIVVDPADPTNNTWFAGAVAGGIWKTTDAGQSWENTTPNLPNLSIAAMVMAPSNQNVLYAGSGEGFYNIDAVRGDGIMKSTDRGVTWAQLPASVAFSSVNRIIVDPSNENILLAAVQANRNDAGVNPLSRIYKSIDGGDSWYVVYDDPSFRRIQHIIADPDSFSVQYASVNALGVIKSIDAGETWTTVLNISSTGGTRLELAMAPSDHDVVYAALDRTGFWSRLYRSEDAGATWVNLDTEGGSVPNWLGSQGWYDNTIAVNPYDPDEVFLGGINLWKRFTSSEGILDVQENGTDAFMTMYPWGGFNNSGVGTGFDFAAALQIPYAPFGLDDDDWTSVEIRFGPGLFQKGHRFTYDPTGQNPPACQGLTDVPFQVWDTDSNLQLAVSFFDHDSDGVFELVPLPNPQDPSLTFCCIHALPYDATNPDPIIMTNDVGFFYKNTYVFWPLLAPGSVWDPQNLPTSDLAIIWGDTGAPVPTFVQISSGYDPYTDTGTHVDHHNLTIIPIDEATGSFRIINGNDGGVYYSDDGGTTWLNTLNGYNTTQFYGVDKKHGADEYIGGMQDNGTWQSPVGVDASAASDWLYRIGGDGYETSWHYEDPSKILGGYQFNGLFRSTDGGASWVYVGDQVDNGAGYAPFVTKVGKTNSDPDLVYTVGVSGVWRSDDFGLTWRSAPIPASQLAMTNMTQVRPSPADTRIVWAGSRMNDPTQLSARILVSTDGGLSFTPTNSYTAETMGAITGLAVHPTDPQTAFVMFSFADAPKILRTTDLGQTWQDISGFGSATESDNGFPDVATYCVLVMPHDPNVLWAGTEIGLFESIDNGATWHYADNGIPAVSIWQLNITDDEVVAATHGLGIWTVSIPELPPPPVVTRVPRLGSLAQGVDGSLAIEVALRSPYDSTQVLVNDVVFATLPANADTTTVTTGYPVTQAMNLEVQAIAYRDGEAYLSAERQTSVTPVQQPQEGYANNFNNPSADFAGNGFTVREWPGFTSPAVHTAHPYPDAVELIYRLLVPIIVSADSAYIRFDEIAIVEPGDPGSEFGDPNFWDYVIVEGSSDGTTWLPLLDGYDARDDAAWLNSYNAGQGGNPSLFRERTIDIHETFAAGETILIRFRLYADDYVTGWGWVIDNLEIQQELPVDDAGGPLPREFLLTQNHPNPFSGSTTIAFALPTAADVSLRVYDLAGRVVTKLTDGRLKAGSYEVVWQAGGLASGTYLCRLEAGDFEHTIRMAVVK